MDELHSVFICEFQESCVWRWSLVYECQTLWVTEFRSFQRTDLRDWVISTPSLKVGDAFLSIFTDEEMESWEGNVI